MRWTEAGFEYEADPRHRQEIMQMTGLTDESKGVVSAALKHMEPEDDDQEGLAPEEKKE